jgi:hypothetical protein
VLPYLAVEVKAEFVAGDNLRDSLSKIRETSAGKADFVAGDNLRDSLSKIR